MLIVNAKHGQVSSVVVRDVIQRQFPFAYCQISIHDVMIIAQHMAELVRYPRIADRPCED